MTIAAKENTTRPYNNTPRGIKSFMNSTERHEARYQRRKAAREAKRREALAKYDDYDRVTAPMKLMLAHRDSRQGTDWKASVARYDMNALRNSVQKSKRLRKGEAICEGFSHFSVMERGKLRDIHSCRYRERVVRRSMCINALVPILSHNLIYDNGASLKGKGLHFCEKRVVTHLHRYYRETGGNDGYVFVIDFKGYYDSIPHDKLCAMLERSIRDGRIVRQEEAYIHATDAEMPPEHAGRGLFIGPEDSQILGVAYPNSIDHYIKDGLRQRYYNRYNDDSYIIVRTLDEAKALREKLFERYRAMGITPNQKKTQIVKLRRGFTFLKTKFILTASGKVIRKADRKAVHRERRKLKAFKRFLDEKVMTLDQIMQSYMSHRGSLARKNARTAIHHTDKLFYALFKARPWKRKKKRRKHYERRETGHTWRNLCLEVLIDGYGLPGYQAL